MVGGVRWPPLTEEVRASGWTTGQSGMEPGSLCWLSLEQHGRGSLTFLVSPHPSLSHCPPLPDSAPGLAASFPRVSLLLWVWPASLFSPVLSRAPRTLTPPPPLPLWVGSVGDSPLNLPGSLVFFLCLLLPTSPLRPRGLPGPTPTPAFWAFLWFVGFCFLANQWQVSEPTDNPLNEGPDAARAAIAVSFFSIFTWVSTPSSQATPARPS